MMAMQMKLGDRVASLPQRSRRLAVLAAFLGYPLLLVGYAVLANTGGLPIAVWAPIAIALFGLTLIGAAIVYGWARSRSEAAARLDERQRAMLDRAHVIGYGVLATLVTALSGWLALMTTFDGAITVDMEGLTPFLLALGLYLPMLPSAILAWIEPDATPDDLEARR